jgi:hypothetical protein
MADSNPQLDSETKIGQITGFLAAGAAISTVAVCLRIFTRAKIIGKLGSDDWTMAVAQVLAIASCVAIGLGKSTLLRFIPGETALTPPQKQSTDWVDMFGRWHQTTSAAI